MVIDVGDVELGGSSSAAARITNNGKGDVSVDSVTLMMGEDTVTSDAIEITVGDGGQLPATLAADGTLEITITIKGTIAVGSLPADKIVIQVSTADGAKKTIEISLKGAIADCADGKANCDDDLSNGCETETVGNMEHCGACNNACKATNGTASCVDSKCVPACDEGWTGDACETDINECDTDNGGCAQTCTNKDGGADCSCKDGFTLNDDAKGCTDINECDTDNGGCANKCNNTDGSYECVCEDGYKLDADDGKSCLDIDECETDNGGCAHTCTNKSGSMECTCKDGFPLNDERKG